MAKLASRKYKKLFCGLALVLFFCLSLEAPLMSYAMDGMDCDIQVSCSSCGCVLNSIVTPVNTSPYFTELAPAPALLISEVLLNPEPPIHPPR